MSRFVKKFIQILNPCFPKGHFFSENMMHFLNCSKNVPKKLSWTRNFDKHSHFTGNSHKMAMFISYLLWEFPIVYKNYKGFTSKLPNFLFRIVFSAHFFGNLKNASYFLKKGTFTVWSAIQIWIDFNALIWFGKLTFKLDFSLA